MGALCILLLIACGFDYRKRRIPNLLIGIMLIAGIVQSGVSAGAMGILYFAGKMLCMILCMYFLFKIGTLGAGDVKLFGVCAGYFPGDKILYFLFFSLLFAAGISLIKLLFEHNAKERLTYLAEYAAGVIQSGSWQLYVQNKREQERHSVCLAGPVLGSVLMYIVDRAGELIAEDITAVERANAREIINAVLYEKVEAVALEVVP
ncbi:MAG: prepilin peptidase, partial [Lachnospiraceae bacterium]|nr:prepilin peptidase [Lachnospiraceae bacterium]